MDATSKAIQDAAKVHVISTALLEMVDAVGLSKVLDLLTDICHEKASESMDDAWEDAAEGLSRVSAFVNV
jgi:hypothetical protein